MFLKFCLWLSYSGHKDLHIENRNVAQASLTSFVSAIIDVPQLSFFETADVHFALNLAESFKIVDKCAKQFWRQVLSGVRKTRQIIFDSADPLFFVLDCLSHILHNVYMIQIAGYKYRGLGLAIDLWKLPTMCLQDLNLVAPFRELGNINVILRYLSKLKRLVSLFVIVTGMEQEVNLMELIKPEVVKIHVRFYIPNCCKLVSEPFERSYPELREIHVQGLTLENNFFSHLSKAVADRKLPSLRYLGFELAGESLNGKIPSLFVQQWPELNHLCLKSCFLSESDISHLFEHRTLFPRLNSLELYLGEKLADIMFTDGFDQSGELPNDFSCVERQIDRPLFKLLAQGWEYLTKLWLFDVNKNEYRNVVKTLNMGSFPRLNVLGIVMWPYAEHEKMKERILRVRETTKGRKLILATKMAVLDVIPAINIQSLTHLILQRALCTMYHLYWMTKSAILAQLHTLDISYSSGISGTLSILLCHTFLSLHTMILSDCGLNIDDIHSLAEANRKGRLPELKALDISKNDEALVHCDELFSCGEEWKRLTWLDCRQSKTDYNAFVSLLQSTHLDGLQFLTNLQTLKVTLDKFETNGMNDFKLQVGSG